MKRIDSLEFTSLMESFGITDPRFIGPLYSQLINADGFGGDGVEFAAAVIAGAPPKDQLMAMQAAQMAVIHWATMKYMRKVADWRESEKGDQQLAVNMATKLARTYSAQLDAIKRYRSGGEQKVTVQHVSVSQNSRAIVGNVTQGALEKPADAPALTDSRQAAMPMTLDDCEKAWREYEARTRSKPAVTDSPQPVALTDSRQPAMPTKAAASVVVRPRRIKADEPVILRRTQKHGR